MQEHRLQISVIGTSQPSEEVQNKAHKVGTLLGNEQVSVICGGGGGVMKAVSKGVQQSNGGQVIGILPGSSLKAGNEYLDVVIPTGIGHARNLPNVLAGQAVIAVGGRFGTLSELSFAQIHDRPIFGVSTWEHPKFNFPAGLSPSKAVQEALKAVKKRG